MKARTDFHGFQLPPKATIRDAMRVMTGPPATSIVLVVDPKDRLLGVVVDFDLRKAILKGHGLSTPLSKVMNPKPCTLPYTMSREAIVEQLHRSHRACIPLVDEAGRVRSLAFLAEYLDDKRRRPNWVVLLVGGAGRRLLPLTEHRPKPLLPVGGKPILETIVEQFIAAGFHKFILAINRHADQFRRHFGDGSRLAAEICYVHEDRPLGTAGSLALLPGGCQDPIIAMNGDLLTKVDFKRLLDFHASEGNLATVCVREYDFQVPYGVIQMDGHHMSAIVEKPTHRFFVNAGIYVLEPSILRLVPRGRAFDMPDLLEKVLTRRSRAVGCFPICEYWVDIGRLDDYERARSEFSQHFTSP